MVAVMDEEASRLLVRIDERQKALTQKVDHIEKRVDDINAQAQRWKGGVVVVLGIGAFVGWLLAQTKAIRDLMGI